jgi:hypothetical protein
MFFPRVKKVTLKLTVRQAKIVDEHPVVWLGFEEDCILTSCKIGEFCPVLVVLHCNRPLLSQPPSLARPTLMVR